MELGTYPPRLQYSYTQRFAPELWDLGEFDHSQLIAGLAEGRIRFRATFYLPALMLIVNRATALEMDAAELKASIRAAADQDSSFSTWTDIAIIQLSIEFG